MKLISIPAEMKASAAAPLTQRGAVMGALETAAARTGADFSYLLKTATQESSLNPEAKASTSSATGLFQFIEQTWLATVKRHGAEHGLATFAAQIERDGNGRYKVAQGGDRQAILALRKDPLAAANMAGELTVEMAGALQAGLGRAPSSGEVYAAHVMGPGGALKLIKASESDPAQSAAGLFPAAAAANRSIFYAKDGSPRSAQGVLAVLTRKHDGAAAPVAMASAQPAAAPVPTRKAADGLRGTLPPEGAAGTATQVWRQGDSEAYVLSPIMVQILSSLDDGASRKGDDETQSRGRLTI